MKERFINVLKYESNGELWEPITDWITLINLASIAYIEYSSNEYGPCGPLYRLTLNSNEVIFCSCSYLDENLRDS